MDLIDSIIKQVGGSDANQDVKDWLSTGLLQLNEAMSGQIGGGFPVGRITEIYGGSSSGKTLLATMAMIETQKKGGLAVFLDHEHAFSIARARTLGLSDDKSQWLYKQPETAEQSFSIIEAICDMVLKQGVMTHITFIIDSVAFMVTEMEMETEYGKENMKTRFSLPTFMSTGLKKLARKISQTNVTLIFLNQTRVNPTVMFGDNETQPGGNALKFAASVRVKLRKGAKYKDGEEIIGENIHVEVVKNKVFEPFRKAQYVTHLTNGINVELSHIEELERRGKMGDSKGYVEWGGKKLRKKQLVEMAQADPNVNAELLALFA